MPKTKEEHKDEEGQAIRTWQKRDDTQLQLGYQYFKGRAIPYLREFWSPEGDGNYIPTKKGVTFTPEMIEDIISGLQELQECLES